MSVSDRELEAAGLAARIIDSVSAGNTAENVRLAASCPPNDYPVLVLTLAAYLVDQEAVNGRMSSEMVKVTAQNEVLEKVSAGLFKEKRELFDRVVELRGILNGRAKTA